jgi:hypothetical protein
VWVSRGDASQYGRVNTQTGEIDTVRSVENPSDIVQNQQQSVMLTRDNALAWSVSGAHPDDIRDDANSDDAVQTPNGTTNVVSAGKWAVTMTKTGNAYLSDLGDRAADGGDGDSADGEAGGDNQGAAGELASGTALTPEGKHYNVDAAAVTADGEVVVYSAANNEVRRYDAETQKFIGRSDKIGSKVSDPQLALVNGKWALLDAKNQLLYREGGDEIELKDAEGALLLQDSSQGQDDPLIADSAGLWKVNDRAERVMEAKGTPVTPTEVKGVMYAAWAGTGSGTLWNSKTQKTASLEYDDSVDELSEPDLTIRNNGQRAVLNEVNTGMLWTLPEGKAIPLSQWELFEPPQEERGEIEVDDVTDPEPPVAVDDSFGVRPGQPSQLPVLLNDYDPNKRDVLTIVPDSIEGLDRSFGSVELMPDGQSLTVTPTADASGTASFTYKVTDGTHTSESATVTLSTASDDTNNGPEWCPVEGCQRPWPAPEITPGGTLVMPMLEGWVDPEGDPIVLESAESADGEMRALVTDEGKLALRHLGSSEGEARVKLTVSDSHGAKTSKDLTVHISNSAKLEYQSVARTVQSGTETTLSPLDRVTGGSGSYSLEDATGSDINVVAKNNQVQVTPKKAGSFTVNITVKDTKTGKEVPGVMRVIATESEAPLTLPTLRAYVKPLTDSTIDVLAALPASESRAAAVTNVKTKAEKGGELHADVVDHSLLRISGSAPKEGFAGSATVSVAEGSAKAKGQVNVFEVADDSSAGAIAVGDSATVRAGSVVDIPVLDNDVSPLGDRLVLDPDVSTSGPKDELAFASGSTLRYLAPSKPGTYNVTYKTYGASSPENSDTAQVQIKVLPREGNRNPAPSGVSERVAPGETSTVDVPLSGVDPDGDRVRVTSVESPDDPQVSATLGNGIEVSASTAAKPGTHEVKYTVRDEFGGEAEGKLRIIVTGSASGAPVVYSDYVRLSVDSDPVDIRPLQNDIDPSGGKLKITDIEPNLPGGEDHPDYDKLKDLINTDKLKDGVVKVDGGDHVGTVSYRYTVQSSQTRSTSDGLVVVQTSQRVGAQAPTVEDTVMTVGDRADLEGDGINVMRDRVRWSAGDPDSLKLSLWGKSADRYSAQGKRIKGEYRAEGDLVPFKLAGKDSLGNNVKTYGFLVIPPLDELNLSLKRDFTELKVDENESVSKRVNDIIALAPGDRLEYAETDLPVRRKNASCRISGNTLTYSAGKGAPWQDQCTVKAKISGQDSYSVVQVPVAVRPTEPVPKLETMTRTFAPGADTTVDLTEMVHWEGGRTGDPESLRYEVSGTGVVQADGSRAQVTLDANATPGTEYVAQVRAIGVTDSVAPLVIRVGQAASDSPRGGTASLQCNVGSSCSTDVLGIPGEYDPFKGKKGGGLKLTSVKSGSCSSLGSFEKSGDRAVRFNWSDSGSAGSTCTASFTVQDAQKRTGTGSIELDARGVPRAPSSLSQVSYSSSSVVMQVSPASERSYPGVTGYVLKEGGSRVGSCDSGGKCTVTGLKNGEKHTYVAHAVNDVGESAGSSSTQAWAYDPPKKPRISASQTGYDSDGVVSIELNGDSDVRGYQVSYDDGGTETKNGRDVKFDKKLSVGKHKITAIPMSQFKPPTSGTEEGNGAETTVQVKGPPTDVSVDLDGSGSSVRATVSAKSEDSVRYGYKRDDGRCDLQGSQSFDISDMNEKYREYSVTPCAENRWGTTEGKTKTVRLGGKDIPKPEGLEYTLSGWEDVGETGRRVKASVSAKPTESNGRVEYRVGGSGKWKDSLQFTGDNPFSEVNARQCVRTSDGENLCSSSTSVAADPPPLLKKIPACLAKKDRTEKEMLKLVGKGTENDVKVSFDGDTVTWIWDLPNTREITLDKEIPEC